MKQQGRGGSMRGWVGVAVIAGLGLVGCGGPIFRVDDVSRLRAVRVMLTEGAERVTFKPSGSYVWFDEESHRQLGSGADGTIIVTAPPEGGLAFRSGEEETTLATKAVRLVSERPVQVGDQRFRGRIVCARNGKNRLLVVNFVAIEEYLKGVVPAEMPASAPREALRAQAVASRTFVCYRIMLGKPVYDVDATVLSQVYRGVGGEASASSLAVEDTAREVLAYGSQLANTPFHSTCGGRTEDIQFVWGRSVPYLVPVECPYCAWTPGFRWKLKADKTELSNLLDPLVHGRAIRGVEVARRTPAGRVSQVKMLTEGGAVEIGVDAVRHRVGVDRLRSSRFEVTDIGDGVVFEGTGWGHGVGLCQNGAIELSRRGTSYQDILKRYYPGTEVRRVARLDR